MKCCNCIYREVDFMSAYDGRNLVEFSYCAKNICVGKMVDPDVERDCSASQERVLEEVEDARKSSR